MKTNQTLTLNEEWAHWWLSIWWKVYTYVGDCFKILNDLIKNSIDLEQGVGPLMIVNYILPCKSKTNLKSKTVFTLNEEWVQHMSLWDAGRLPFTWGFIWMIVIMVTTPIVIWKSGWSSLYDSPALQFPFQQKWRATIFQVNVHLLGCCFFWLGVRWFVKDKQIWQNLLNKSIVVRPTEVCCCASLLDALGVAEVVWVFVWW